MSDKNLLLAEEQSKLDKATAEFNLKKSILAALPESMEVESIYPFGYCAQATLAFRGEEQLQALLDQMSPIPCTYVLDNSWTVKPTAFLRESDHGKKQWAYPVTCVFPKGDPAYARWWTQIDGKTVEINVKGVGSLESFQRLISEDWSRYQPCSHQCSTGATTLWLRRPKSVKDLPVVSPMEKWHAEWDAWAQRKGFDRSPKRMMFIRAFRAITERDGEAVLPPTDDGDYNTNPLARIGNFWVSFSEEQAKELQSFAAEQRAKLASVKAEIVENLKTAEAWFKNFFATKGDAGDVPEQVFAYLFRKETGVAGTINWARKPHRLSPIEVGFTLDKEHIRVQCGSAENAPAIDWEVLTEYH